MVAADDRTAVAFSLSPGQNGDAPEGGKRLETLKNKAFKAQHMIMDRAYEGDETRQHVFKLHDMICPC